MMLKVVTGNLSYQLLDLLQNFLKDISEWRDADLSHHRLFLFFLLIMLMLESPWRATCVLGDARSRVSFFPQMAVKEVPKKENQPMRI